MKEIKVRIVGPPKSGKSTIATEIVKMLKARGINEVVLDESVKLDGGHLYGFEDMRIEINEVQVPRPKPQ